MNEARVLRRRALLLVILAIHDKSGLSSFPHLIYSE